MYYNSEFWNYFKNFTVAGILRGNFFSGSATLRGTPLQVVNGFHKKPIDFAIN